MSYSMISILRIGSLRSPPPIRLRRTSPCSGGRIGFYAFLQRHGSIAKHPECPLEEGERWWRQPPKWECISSIGARLACFPTPAGRYKKWRRRRRTSPAGTVSQPIGKPFNGQAKGLLWLTWRSYAGPPQYYITPVGRSPQPVREASAGPGQNPDSPGPKGPAAGSTLTPVRACQPSGIPESTAPVPTAPQACPRAAERPYCFT